MQKYSNVVQDTYGNIVPTASITVNIHSGAQATVYSNNTLTVLSQPFTPNQYGEFFFYAADGRYDVNVTYSSTTYVEYDILLQDYTTALAASSGSSLVGFIQAGAGAVAETVQTKLRESVSVQDFGAVGDGTTDDTAAFTAALATLGALGGTVFFSMRHYIAGPLTVPANCTIKGPISYVGAPVETNPSPPFGTMAALILNTSNPIYLNEGAGIDGALIVPSGMTFPQASASGWVGTAVQSRGDNVYVINSMILGFNQAINFSFQSSFTGTITGTSLVTSGVGAVPIAIGQAVQCIGIASGTFIIAGSGSSWTVSVSQSIGPIAMTGNLSQECKFVNNKIDCVNGIYMQDPQNIAHCSGNVCFPYATIGTVTKPSNWADRLGYAFYCNCTYVGSGATANWYDNLSFGYLVGFAVVGTTDSILDGCWADGTNALANSYGFQIEGAAGVGGGVETKCVSCIATAEQFGFYISTPAGTETMMVHNTVSNCEVSHISGANRSIQIQVGDVYVLGATIRGSGSGGSGGYTDFGVYINNAASRVIIDGLRTQGLTGAYAPIYNQLSTPYLFLGVNDFRDWNAGSPTVFQAALQTIASASTMLLPSTPIKPEIYLVSGTTNSGQLAGGYLGREVTLIFQGALSLFPGGGSPNGMVLLGGVTQNVVVGSIVRLIYTSAGTWQQLPAFNPWYVPAGSSATTAAGSTTNVFTNTTFTGSVGSTAYTITDLVSALKTLGVIKP